MKTEKKMFRVVEKEDGSTVIIDKSSGKQLCKIPSASANSSTDSTECRVQIKAPQKSLPKLPKEVEEPEIDCIDVEDFFRYLDLLPKLVIEKQTPQSIRNNWPLRDVSKNKLDDKVHSSTASDSNGSVANVNKMKSETQTTKPLTLSVANNIPLRQSNSVKSTYLGDHSYPQILCDTHIPESINGSSEKSLIFRIKDQSSSEDVKHVILNTANNNNSSVRSLHPVIQTKNCATKYLKEIALSSPLGRKIVGCVPSLVSTPPSLTDCVRSYERHCGTANRQVLAATLNHVPTFSIETTNSRSRLTRANGGNSWSSSNYTHTYAFSKAQRRERWKTLETGLNWQGRMLRKCCKPCFISLEVLQSCPQCKETLQTFHSCDLVSSDSFVDIDEPGAHS